MSNYTKNGSNFIESKRKMRPIVVKKVMWVIMWHFTHLHTNYNSKKWFDYSYCVHYFTGPFSETLGQTKLSIFTIEQIVLGLTISCKVYWWIKFKKHKCLYLMLWYLCNAPKSLEKVNRSAMAIYVQRQCKIWLKF